MFENLYKELLVKINQGNQCVMLTYLNLHSEKSGAIEKKLLLTREELENKSISLDHKVCDTIFTSLDNGKVNTINTEENKSILVEPFFPKPRLIVFGGGHIAKPLVEFSSRVGFAVTLIDDRPAFANNGRFPEAEKVICESFEKSFDSIRFRKSDFVVIITRGHRHDGVVLRHVLNHELSYVGMIGSKRRVRGMMDELLDEGFSKEKLDLVNSPIGLDIGAITPDEIAISIVSQLISFKNKGVIDRLGKNFSFPDFDKEVAEKIAEDSEMPKALITILSSKGSVPRKPGAKMIAYFDGRTLGSIGGGCSEAAVLTNARGVMLDKGFFIQHVDMTGDVAESQGMVCGGVMDVLVESF
ncbi:XdhC family protein [Clostridium hydrogeniformans]|uniref:XdhC family protein n=1 Tax=Clostridium hydrogeniformans TaxID=349933 RepID=UPI000484DCA5|nr:XdhC/CoxI family protein [Clostridium hydrogeniformans]